MLYNIDVIQRRFWLGAMYAPYLDRALENRRKTFRKKKILEKIIVKRSKKEFLNGERTHYRQLEVGNSFWINISAGLWWERSTSAQCKQAEHPRNSQCIIMHNTMEHANSWSMSIVQCPLKTHLKTLFYDQFGGIHQNIPHMNFSYYPRIFTRFL